MASDSPQTKAFILLKADKNSCGKGDIYHSFHFTDSPRTWFFHQCPVEILVLFMPNLIFKDNKCWWEQRIRTLIQCWWENKMVQLLWKTWTSSSTSRYKPKRSEKIYTQTDLYTNVPNSIIHNNREYKQFKSPTKWMDKPDVHIHTKECYSIAKNGVLPNIIRELCWLEIYSKC